MRTLLFYLFFFILLTACSNEEDKAWDVALSQNSGSALDSFLLVYPDSKYALDVATYKEDFAWYAAKRKHTVYNYKKYLVDFPNGKYKELVSPQIDSISSNNINLEELTQSTFVGKIDYGNREIEVIGFSFSEIRKDSAGIRFIANINTSDNRKTIEGRIDPNGYVIMFMENTGAKTMLNITDGRAYRKGNKIMLESTNVNQYWNLIKYDEG
jgi:hypothetical protein